MPSHGSGAFCGSNKYLGEAWCRGLDLLAEEGCRGAGPAQCIKHASRTIWAAWRRIWDGDAGIEAWMRIFTSGGLPPRSAGTGKAGSSDQRGAAVRCSWGVCRGSHRFVSLAEAGTRRRCPALSTALERSLDTSINAEAADSLMTISLMSIGVTIYLCLPQSGAPTCERVTQREIWPVRCSCSDKKPQTLVKEVSRQSTAVMSSCTPDNQIKWFWLLQSQSGPVSSSGAWWPSVRSAIRGHLGYP